MTEPYGAVAWACKEQEDTAHNLIQADTVAASAVVASAVVASAVVGLAVPASAATASAVVSRQKLVLHQHQT